MTHATASLLQRAVALLPVDDPQRIELMPELGETLMGLGDFARARAVLDESISAAERTGNLRVKTSSQVVKLLVRLFSGEPGDWGDETLKAAHGFIPLLEGQSAHNELALTWRLIGLVHGVAGRYSRVSEAIEQSTARARNAGNTRLVMKNSEQWAMIALLGPTPVPLAIEQCERLLVDGLADRQIECSILCVLAQLKAMNGELEAARDLYRRGRAMLRDLGQGMFVASMGNDLARIELHGGDLTLAEREVRKDFEFLKGAGETYFLSSMSALLGRIVRDQGRHDEAFALTEIAKEATAADDVESQALWRSVRAPILAHAGDAAQAEELARDAVRMARATEAPCLQADALAALAEVLNLSSKISEARNAIDEAIALYTAKGNTVAAARCNALYSQLSQA